MKDFDSNKRANRYECDIEGKVSRKFYDAMLIQIDLEGEMIAIAKQACPDIDI